MFITTIIVTLLAYYCASVVEFNAFRDIIDARLEKIETRLEDDSEERQALTDEIVSDCEEKARMVAMLISQSATDLSYELSLEEIRVIANVEEITVCKPSGAVEYSTSTYGADDTIEVDSAFLVKDKGFTKSTTDDDGQIVTTTTRLDDDGVVRLVFSSDSMRNTLKSTDISMVTSEYPLFKNGFTAIIDSTTYTYLSHTDTTLVGTPSQLPQDMFNFDKSKGGFFCSVAGTKSYVRYAMYDDKVLLGVIPTSEIYRLRNAVTGWVLFSGIVLTGTSILSVRFSRLKHASNTINR
jgi:hypothetical protein